MLQKTGNILLALLVLCTTTGMVINQHYSNGELYSTSIYSNPDSCCDNDTEEVNTCHEESVVFKVKDYFRASQAVNVKAQFSYILQKINITELFNYTAPVIKTPLNLFKPLKPKIPKSEFLQVFIL